MVYRSLNGLIRTTGGSLERTPTVQGSHFYKLALVKFLLISEKIHKKRFMRNHLQVACNISSAVRVICFGHWPNTLQVS